MLWDSIQEAIASDFTTSLTEAITFHWKRVLTLTNLESMPSESIKRE